MRLPWAAPSARLPVVGTDAYTRRPPDGLRGYGEGASRAAFDAYEAAGVDSRFSGSVVAW